MNFSRTCHIRLDVVHGDVQTVKVNIVLLRFRDLFNGQPCTFSRSVLTFTSLGAMNGSFRSGSLTLNRYLAVPSGHNPQLPGVILCHGFPIGPLDARQSAVTFPQLMDRVANDLGWAALTFTFRGCGDSDGDYRATIMHSFDLWCIW